MSRRSAPAIFRLVFLSVLNRLVAVMLCVTVFFMGLPPGDTGSLAAAEPAQPAEDDVAAVSHRLRDAIPASSFVAAQPDTVEEDDFFLPEKTDNKKLIRDITVFVIVAVAVAYFIIKVFIEKDPDPPPDDSGGKPIPPPS